MKWVVPALAVALTGCANVADIEQSPETMSVISGKSPREYAACVQQRLADSRGPLTIEEQGNGLRVVVPQKLSDKSPAAVLEISQRSSGSAIKLHERLSNFPLRPGDVKGATTWCISK